MRKIILGLINLLVWLNFLANPVFAQEDNTYVLNTFYPVLYGTYSQLRFSPIPHTEITPCKIGTMYFNQQGKLRICQSDASGHGQWNSPLIWDKNGNNVFLRDSANKKVGIGTVTPEFRLTLANDGAILATGTFGSGVDLASTGAGSKLIWSPKKGAFRAGTVTGHHWDDSYSPAMFVWWMFADYSVATGLNTVASGPQSIAFGAETYAHGPSSLALGYDTQAEAWFGAGSVAMGYKSESGHIGGDGAVAIGSDCQAKDFYSVAMGNACETHSMRAVAIGDHAIANGYASCAIGKEALTDGIGGHAIGTESEVSNPWTSTKGGFALGYQAKAQNKYAMAIGSAVTAVALGSTSIGGGYTANGADRSTSIGFGQRVLGEEAFSIGYDASANADQSFALGRSVRADAYRSFVFGQYNIYGTEDRYNWVTTDPLFVIANGTSTTNRHNALTILKNGNVGIKTHAPTSPLHIVGIQEYTDNAAAVAAGLQPGDFYRTGDELRIVF
jgi:hypothetical protein